MRINPRIKGVLHLEFIFGNTNILLLFVPRQSRRVGQLKFVLNQANFLLNEAQKMHF